MNRYDYINKYSKEHYIRKVVLLKKDEIDKLELILKKYNCNLTKFIKDKIKMEVV